MLVPGMAAGDGGSAQDGIAPATAATISMADMATAGGGQRVPAALKGFDAGAQAENGLQQADETAGGPAAIGQQCAVRQQGGIGNDLPFMQRGGQQAGQSPQQRYRRAGLGCGVAWSEAVFAEAAVELGKLAMLEQVEEGCGSPVFLTLALLQPFLIGVGQRTIRAAQTEKMDVHLRWRPLAAGREVADGAGWKQRRKRSVQAH